MSSESDRQNKLKSHFSSYSGNKKTGKRYDGAKSGSDKLADFKAATANTGTAQTQEEYNAKVVSQSEEEKAANRLITGTGEANRTQAALNTIKQQQENSQLTGKEKIDNWMQEQAAKSTITQNQADFVKDKYLLGKPDETKTEEYKRRVKAAASDTVGAVKRVYEGTNERISNLIPSFDEVIEKRDQLELVQTDAMGNKGEKNNLGKALDYIRDTAHSNEKIGAGVDAYAAFGQGVYEEAQERPLDTAVTVGIGYATAGGVGLLTKGAAASRVGLIASKTPVLATVGKYTLPAAELAIGGIYAADIGHRVSADVTTYTEVTDEKGNVIDVLKDTRKATTEEKAERLGRITSGEIIPFSVGAGLYGLRNPSKIVSEEITELKEVEYISGFTQTNGKTKIITDKVVSSNPITAEEIAGSKLSTRNLNAKVTVYESELGGATRTTPAYDTSITISEPTSIKARGQRAFNDEGQFLDNEILSLAVGDQQLSVNSIMKPTGKTPNLNEFAAKEPVFAEFKAGYGDKFADERTTELIRGKITGSVKPVEELTLSGSTGKIQQTGGVIKEIKWEQKGLDDGFRSIALKDEYAHESGIFASDKFISASGKSKSGDILPDMPTNNKKSSLLEIKPDNVERSNLYDARIKQMNKELNLTEPAGSPAKEKVINLDIRPDRIDRPARSPRGSNPAKAENALEYKQNARAMSRNPELYEPEQVTGIKSIQKVTQKVTQKPTFKPAFVPAIRVQQGVNYNSIVKQSQGLTFIQSIGQTQKQGQSQAQRQKQATGQTQKQELITDNITDLTERTKGRKATEEGLLIIPPVPALVLPENKGKKKGNKAGVVGYDYRRTTNKYKNPAEMNYDTKGLI